MPVPSYLKTIYIFLSILQKSKNKQNSFQVIFKQNNTYNYQSKLNTFSALKSFLCLYQYESLSILVLPKNFNLMRLLRNLGAWLHLKSKWHVGGSGVSNTACTCCGGAAMSYHCNRTVVRILKSTKGESNYYFQFSIYHLQ